MARLLLLRAELKASFILRCSHWCSTSARGDRRTSGKHVAYSQHPNIANVVSPQRLTDALFAVFASSSRERSSHAGQDAPLNSASMTIALTRLKEGWRQSGSWDAVGATTSLEETWAMRRRLFMRRRDGSSIQPSQFPAVGRMTAGCADAVDTCTD